MTPQTAISIIVADNAEVDAVVSDLKERLGNNKAIICKHGRLQFIDVL